MPNRQRRDGADTDRYRLHGPDSPVTALAFGTTAASVNVLTRDAVLLGWALVETTGTAGTAFDLVDGADDNAPVLAPFTLAANESTRDTLSSWGLWVQRGLRVKVLSGSVRGTLWVVLPGPNAGA